MAVELGELPSWEMLTRLARILDFRVEERHTRPVPIDRSKLYVVRSLNQTANKPLHLGHLRNSALGAAAAGSASVLGARVLRHCVVEDTGRFMTEAMAAVAELERHSSLAAAVASGKGDHFVGDCYARYRRVQADKRGESVSAGVYYAVRNDAADALQHALVRGEKEARRLWRTIGDLTLTGQQETLQRLGIEFDCCDYESAEDGFVDAFVGRGLARGVLEREASGDVCFTPARGSKLRLVNALGFPEESARLLSLIWRLLTSWPGGAIHVIVAGTEWKASMEVYPELLNRLGLERVEETYGQAFYGMVMRDGVKMSSSDGSGVLVDNLLDELGDERAATVLKCHLLSFPRAERIEFDVARLRDPATNSGWEIADACRENGQDAAVSPGADALVADALARVSFERVVGHAGALARAILGGRASAGERSDFRALVRALSVAPRRSDFTFGAAVPLATMPEPV